MSKNIHVPIRNNTAETTGRLHKYWIFFPVKIPIITEYNGLTAKNKRKHTAIPASSFTKVTTSHGSASITTVETATHKVKSFFIILQKYLPLLKSHSLSHSKPPLVPSQSAEVKFYTPLQNTI